MQKGPSKADLDLQLCSVSSALDMKIVYRPEDTSALDSYREAAWPVRARPPAQPML